MGRKVCNGAGDAELVFAESRLGRGLRDGLIEDTGMASLIVADLDDPLVCRVGISSFLEGCLIERLYAILVEGIDGPLSTEEVLEEKVVSPWGSLLGGKDWLSVVSREWRSSAVVAAVIGGLARDGTKVGVVEGGA